MKHELRRASAVVGIALAATAVSSCDAESGAQTSQVVARVNDAEITISQLRATLIARGEAEPSPTTAQRTLDGLVNEQLLVEAAVRNELDRDPAVVMALEATRRQILANAFVERVVYPQEQISAADQAAYFRNHPELFSKRQTYQLATFSCPMPLPDAVRTALDSTATPEELTNLLEAHELDCSTQMLTRASEQLAFDQLPQFALAKPGDVAVQTESDGGTTLMLIASMQPSPITFESAQPLIQQYLASVRNAEALDVHLRQARSLADITHADASLFAEMRAPAGVVVPAAEAEAIVAQDSGAAILD
jgi:EpsD family peptidyl-prolyl cis-trans isomerase